MARLVRIPPSLARPDLVRRLPTNVNFRDRTGEKPIGCTIVGYAGILPPNFSAWLCRCDCGKRFIASSSHLNHPKVGCGCRQQTRHGLKGSVLYRTWKKMMASCYQADHPQYPRIGALGAKVCKRWRESVTYFAADVGEPPSRDHVLERINQAKDFTASNCHWVHRFDSQTARYGRSILLNGERLSIKEAAARLGITRQGLERRIKECLVSGVRSKG